MSEKQVLSEKQILSDKQDSDFSYRSEPVKKGSFTEDTSSCKTPYIIVVGNEKGGAGKSTIAIHISMALLRMKLRVGVVDLDVRQRTLDRYLNNRKYWSEKNNISLPAPYRMTVEASKARVLDQAEEEEKENWLKAYHTLSQQCDFIVIDAPGSYTYLSWLVHGYAHTILTPINDSFVDFDLLAQVDPQTYEVGKPSHYSTMVWECRKRCALRDQGMIDWVVMRNRMSMIDARNKRRLGKGLETLSKRIGFRVVPGFSERVIYREMFPSGLTLLDLKESASSTRIAMSHIAARQELRELILSLKLSALEGKALIF